MDAYGKKVAIIVDNYFEESELAEPKKALEAAGVTVEIVAPKRESLTAMQHVNRGGTYTVHHTLDEADPSAYDAVVIPGGVINADKLRMEIKAREWVRDYLAAGKPVAVICHGPWLLVSANVLQGRRLTSYYTLQDDIRNAGGDWQDQTVVVDRNLITSRNPDDLPAFNQALLEALATQK
jgi:protease I